MSSRCREDWQSATVINSSLVDNSTVWPPDFQLIRRQWSLLNRFQTGQGHCGTCRQKMGSDRQWNVCLRRHPDSVTYRWFLLADQTWRRSMTYTHCRQSCCRLYDVVQHTHKQVNRWEVGCALPLSNWNLVIPDSDETRFIKCCCIWNCLMATVDLWTPDMWIRGLRNWLKCGCYVDQTLTIMLTFHLLCDLQFCSLHCMEAPLTMVL